MGVKSQLKNLLQPILAQRDFASLPAIARQEHERDKTSPLLADPGIDAVVAAGIGWLYRAQDASPSADGGVARDYSLVSGWASSYPETTGYIVPTLIEWAQRSGDDEALRRAQRMLDWFVEIQFPEGGFQGGKIDAEPCVPVTFNTGQILLGLAAGTLALGDKYREPMNRAATWLRDTLDEDGAWRRFGTPFAAPGEKAYETHVAWGLFEAERVELGRGYGEAGLRNVRWAMRKQRPNGWFADCCLIQPDAPLTHTIGYVVRGILEGYRLSDDAEMLASARRALDALQPLIDDDGRLPGRLDASWRSAVDWVCFDRQLTARSLLPHGVPIDSGAGVPRLRATLERLRSAHRAG